MTDNINHPAHYTSHPSGVECIQVTEHYNFCVGNAIKYLWRAGLKNDAVEDLKKARWYLDREISNREKTAAVVASTPVPSPCRSDDIVSSVCSCGAVPFHYHRGDIPPSVIDAWGAHSESGCNSARA